jgi:hypothetical protein
MQTLRKDNQVNNIKQILVRSIGLTLATAFGGTAIGAFAGDWLMGTIIGIGSAFAVALTILGVSLTWNGTLSAIDIQNAFRAAVAKSDSDGVQDALKVAEDGNFDWDDVEDYEDIDTDLADPNVRPE